jgi:hypothetical protein
MPHRATPLVSSGFRPYTKDEVDFAINAMKGQAAEFAFERMALKAGWEVRYNGQQYRRWLSRGAAAEAQAVAPPEAAPPQSTATPADFAIRTQQDGTNTEYRVEVKFCTDRKQLNRGKVERSDATHLVVFTPEEILACTRDAFLDDGATALRPIPEVQDLQVTMELAVTTHRLHIGMRDVVLRIEDRSGGSAAVG